jgi:hypothetical protein
MSPKQSEALHENPYPLENTDYLICDIDALNLPTDPYHETSTSLARTFLRANPKGRVIFVAPSITNQQRESVLADEPNSTVVSNTDFASFLDIFRVPTSTLMSGKQSPPPISSQ